MQNGPKQSEAVPPAAEPAPTKAPSKQPPAEVIKSEATPKEIKAEVTPKEIKAEVTPTEIKGAVTPKEIKGEEVPKEIKAEVTPKEIKGAVTPKEIKAEVTPKEITGEVTSNEIKSKVTPKEIKAEGTVQEIKGEVTPLIVNKLKNIVASAYFAARNLEMVWASAKAVVPKLAGKSGEEAISQALKAWLDEMAEEVKNASAVGVEHQRDYTTMVIEKASLGELLGEEKVVLAEKGDVASAEVSLKSALQRVISAAKTPQGSEDHELAELHGLLEDLVKQGVMGRIGTLPEISHAEEAWTDWRMLEKKLTLNELAQKLQQLEISKGATSFAVFTECKNWIRGASEELKAEALDERTAGYLKEASFLLSRAQIGNCIRDAEIEWKMANLSEERKLKAKLAQEESERQARAENEKHERAREFHALQPVFASAVKSMIVGTANGVSMTALPEQGIDEVWAMLLRDSRLPKDQVHLITILGSRIAEQVNKGRRLTKIEEGQVKKAITTDLVCSLWDVSSVQGWNLQVAQKRVEEALQKWVSELPGGEDGMPPFVLAVLNQAFVSKDATQENYAQKLHNVVCKARNTKKLRSNLYKFLPCS